MLKKTITYTDFNDVERTEDFYFHFTEAELTEMNLDENGDLAGVLQKIIDSKDMKKIKDYFKWIVLKSYGEKSEDGRRFMKSEERTKAFEETQAYSDIWMELATDETAAADFVNGIMPKKLVAEMAKQENKQPALSEVAKPTE